MASTTDIGRPALVAADATVTIAAPAHPLTRVVANVASPAPLPDAVTLPVEVEVEVEVVEPVVDPGGERFRDGLVMTGATPHRLILFTFDDGPDTRNTPQLLEALDTAGIKAVFFVTASRFSAQTPRQRAQAELAREIVRRGHVIANHTLNHSQLPLLDYDAIVHEVEEAERIIERTVGVRPWLFRPPGGGRSARTDRIIESRGYTNMLWNLGTGDFQVRTADDVVRTWLRVMDRRERDTGERGGIVLMHDTHRWSVEAFPRMVAELRSRNCDLLREGEELYDIVDDPSLFFTPRGDAEYGSEAPPTELREAELEARQTALRERAERRCGAVASR